MKNINKRSVVSLFVLSTFMIITVTSILMFSQPYKSSVALLHTIMGFCLILVAVFHMKNNITPLTNYLNIKTRTAGGINLALPLVLLSCALPGTLAYLRLPPMESVYKWGNSLRANTAAGATNELIYAIINKTKAGNSGPTLTIDVRKGPYFTWPQYAIWVEDMQGNLIQPLFVTSKIAKNNFVNQVTKVQSDIAFDSHVFLSGDVDLATTFESGVFPESRAERARPESLPVFLHKQMHKQMHSAGRHSLIPQGDSAIADAYTGATVNQSFLVTSNLHTSTDRQFKVRLEINTSFDFNDYYSSDRFPDDPVYSGNGYGAQPSLIYETIIDLDTPQEFYAMQLMGRGHHSGQDGELYQDLENITTAREIVDRIIVEVK